MSSKPKKSELKRLASSSGWDPIEIDKLLNSAEVGKLFAEAGLVHVGLNVYAVSRRRGLEALDKLGDALDLLNADNPEMVIAVSKAIAQMVDVNNKTAEGIIKSLHHSNPNRKPVKGLPPGSQVVPRT